MELNFMEMKIHKKEYPKEDPVERRKRMKDQIAYIVRTESEEEFQLETESNRAILQGLVLELKPAGLLNDRIALYSARRFSFDKIVSYDAIFFWSCKYRCEESVFSKLVFRPSTYICIPSYAVKVAHVKIEAFSAIAESVVAATPLLAANDK